MKRFKQVILIVFSDRLPLPPGAALSLWQNDELFKKLYFTKFPVRPADSVHRFDLYLDSIKPLRKEVVQCRPLAEKIFDCRAACFHSPIRASPRATTTPWTPVLWMKRTSCTSCLGLMMSSTWQATGCPLAP